MDPKSTSQSTAQQRHDTNYYPDEGFFDEPQEPSESETDEARSDDDEEPEPNPE